VQPVFGPYQDTAPQSAPRAEVSRPPAVSIDFTATPDPVRQQAATIPSLESFERSLASKPINAQSGYVSPYQVTQPSYVSPYPAPTVSRPITNQSTYVSPYSAPKATELDIYPEDLALEADADANFAESKRSGPSPRKLTRSLSARVANPGGRGVAPPAPPPTPVRMQKCLYCPAYFVSVQDLVDHTRAVHQRL
jgi:hypothetical protein